MSGLPMLSSSKKAVFFRSLGVHISNFIFLCCSPVFSQPLYFCYFLFFSPYIIKPLSFLSPLFITTSLVLLSVHELNFVSFLADASDLSEEHEYYKILFGTAGEDAAGEEVQETVDKFLIHGSTIKEDPVEKNETEIQGSKTGEALFEEKEESDEITAFSMAEGQDVKPLGTESEKVVAAEGEKEEPVLMRGESYAQLGDKITPRWQLSRSSNVTGDGIGVPGDASPALGSSGSMRKEREWRRTLACKLFEERHNAGEEGMDLLWEKYEDDSSQGRRRSKERKNKADRVHPGPEEKPEHEEEDEEDVDEQQICCLQALKFSAGKMNMVGLGRPNIMKISRAIRGIGWLHNVRRHTKVQH